MHVFLIFFYMFRTTLIDNLNFQKIIPFHEITYVRRAKAIAVFPTSIEIIAGAKKVRCWFTFDFVCFCIYVFSVCVCVYLYTLFWKILKAFMVFSESYLCSITSRPFCFAMKHLSLSVKAGFSTVMRLKKLQTCRYPKTELIIHSCLYNYTHKLV